MSFSLFFCYPGSEPPSWREQRRKGKEALGPAHQIQFCRSLTWPRHKSTCHFGAFSRLPWVRASEIAYSSTLIQDTVFQLVLFNFFVSLMLSFFSPTWLFRSWSPTSMSRVRVCWLIWAGFWGVFGNLIAHLPFCYWFILQFANSSFLFGAFSPKGCTWLFNTREYPSKAKNVTPKYVVKFLSQHLKISARTINSFKIATNFTRISKNCFHVWAFSAVLPKIIRLRNQYPLTQKYQTPPITFDPKISDGHFLC